MTMGRRGGRMTTRGGGMASCDLNVFKASSGFVVTVRVTGTLSDSAVIPSAFRGGSTGYLVTVRRTRELGMDPLVIVRGLCIVRNEPS